MLNHDLPSNLGEIQLAKESLVSVGNIPVCVDDREPVDMANLGLEGVFVSPEQADIGPKFLGGSLIALPILAVTVPENEVLDSESMINFLFAASEKVGFEVGVHMDNHHDELELQEIVTTVEKIMGGNVEIEIPGCGFWGAVNSPENILGLNSKAVQFFKDNPRLLQRVVQKGGRLAVLEGHHASKDNGQAWAVRNRDGNVTVSRKKIREQGQVAPYAHDDAPLGKYLEALACVVGEAGKPEWAENIRSQGLELNEVWLKKVSLMLLGKEAQPIN